MAVSVFVGEQRLITNVYIDGFNLYYRTLKDSPFRWLDLRTLAETLFPQDSINLVWYFHRAARRAARQPWASPAPAHIPESLFTIFLGLAP